MKKRIFKYFFLHFRWFIVPKSFFFFFFNSPLHLVVSIHYLDLCSYIYTHILFCNAWPTEDGTRGIMFLDCLSVPLSHYCNISRPTWNLNFKLDDVFPQEDNLMRFWSNYVEVHRGQLMKYPVLDLLSRYLKNHRRYEVQTWL